MLAANTEKPKILRLRRNPSLIPPITQGVIVRYRFFAPQKTVFSKQFLYSVVNDLPPEGDSRISPDATQTTHTHKTNTPFSVANTAPGLEYFYVFF